MGVREGWEDGSTGGVGVWESGGVGVWEYGRSGSMGVRGLLLLSARHLHAGVCRPHECSVPAIGVL